MQPFLNSSTQSIGAYASKAISGRAKSDPSIANLAIGEPDFGPPEYLAEAIQAHHLNYPSFVNAAKGYEQSRGLHELRCAISQWYRSTYNYHVDPDTELLITHGGVEAIAPAILCTSDPGDTILITDPTYMLYARSIQTLSRKPVALVRTADSEYLGMIADAEKMAGARQPARALVVNSPENPTGYVLDQDEWRALAIHAEARNLWIVHDEVYDTMAHARPHLPARCIDGLGDRAILVNSFSKKFGVPGLRIGWLCAKPELISLAAKLHDYLYLGVNVLFEHIALTLISDPSSKGWLDGQSNMLRDRADRVVKALTTSSGFRWIRQPLGGMFAFPDVEELANRIPRSYLEKYHLRGDAVAQFLLEQQKVAVVPGSIYGSQGDDSIRLVLSCTEATLQTAIARLTAFGRSASGGA